MIEFVINSQDPEMAEKYSLRPGIGLAAPQIGVSKMIAVHVTDADGTLYSHALFNPKSLAILLNVHIYRAVKAVYL